MANPTDTIEQYDWEKQNLVDEKLYQRGINDGYIIAKHEPKLADGMSKTMNPDKIYECGFLEGIKELQKELSQQRLAELQKIRSKGKDRDNDRGR